MPQMAPIWWSSLFIMFILSFMMIMTMIYFFYNYCISNSQKSKDMIKKNINWKW